MRVGFLQTREWHWVVFQHTPLRDTFCTRPGFGSGSCSLWRFTFTRLCSASGSVTSGTVRTDETRKNLCRQASLHGTIRTCHHALRAPQAIRRGGLRGRRERPELLYGGFGSFKKPAGVYRLPVDAPESHVLRTVGRPRGGKTCL